MIKTFFFVFCRQLGNCQYGAKCTREQKHYHDDHDCTWLVVMENLLKQNCVWIKPAGTFLCHGFGSFYFIFDVCSCYVNFFSFFFYSLVFFTFVCLFCFDLFFFSDSLKIKWWFNALKLWQGHTSIKHSFTHHLIYYSSKIHEKISQFWLVKRNAVFR